MSRRASAIGALAAAALALSLAATESPAGIPIGDGEGDVKLRRIATVQGAVHVESAPGRRNRELIFVVEQGGTVRVVERGKLRSRPFLDLTDRVRSGGEQGLLSIAFAPDYARSRRFYVYYTNSDGNIQVSQFRRSRHSRLRARPKSERTVIEIPHPGTDQHNGAQVTFGPDDKLWFATGDGGFDCDPEENAQNPDSLLGKLLRVAPKRDGGYRIPADNPNVGRAGRDEIYAMGLRNPFRFSFDRVTGEITIGDVGQHLWEEIDHLTLEMVRGANFGWDAFEGSGPFPCGGDEAPAPANHTAPIHEYSHSNGRCAITGGLVVRDRKLTSLYGRYLYADFCRGRLRSLIASPEGAADDRALGIRVKSPTSFSDGKGGRVYLTSLVGGVFRLARAGGSG
jgi:glucose/arabinose dehydrogenase